MYRNLITLLVTLGSLTVVVLFVCLPSPGLESTASRKLGNRAGEKAGERLVQGSANQAAQARSRLPYPFADFHAEGMIMDVQTARPITDRRFTVHAYSPVDPRSPLEGSVDPASGCYRLSGLQFGPYCLWVCVEGYLPAWTLIEAPLTGRAALWLEPAGRVRIKVTDHYACKLSQAWVQRPGVQAPLFPPLDLCRREEGYLVVDGLKAGRPSLRIGAPGYEHKVVKVLVTQDQIHSYWIVFDGKSPQILLQGKPPRNTANPTQK
jgi:hypothetical protein